MARDLSRGGRAAAPSRQDNFTRIQGIGPTINERLHRAGIQTFAQLAASSPDVLATLDIGRSPKRIAKERWIGQARKLAARRVPVRAPSEAKALCSPQHYETFTIELLLSADNDVRRTRVVHIQSGVEDSWPGWDNARLTGLLMQRAAIHLSSTDLTHPLIVPAVPTGSLISNNLSGTLRLHKADIIPVDADSPPGSVRGGRPFEVELAVDLADVVGGSESPLAYTVILSARRPGSGKRQVLCEEHGLLAHSHMITARVESTRQMRGIHRLEAFVTLAPQLAEPETPPGLIAMKEIGLLQIY